MIARLGRHVRQQFVGYIALFIALGGVSYAAVTLPRNSVGTAQIKPGAVKNSDLGKNAVTSSKVKNGQIKNADLAINAVTSSKVKNGSLLSKDFKPGQLVAGAPGPQGPTGTNGTNAATNVVVRKNSKTIAGGSNEFVSAFCNAGEKATGGGAKLFDMNGTAGNAITASQPAVMVFSSKSNSFIAVSPSEGQAPNAWYATAQNASTGDLTLFVYVICSSP